MGRTEETPPTPDAASKAEFDAMPYVQRLREVFVRTPNEPIIAPKDMPMPCKAVCNPGATEFEGDVLLLLRVIDESDRSSLVVARARDGYRDWRIESAPLLAPSEWYDELGCEDARITYLADREEYVITYAGNSRYGASVCLATTKDFKTVQRLGMVIHPYNKDAVLFPEKIDGKYRLLHRPTILPHEDIWISESDDLLHWGAPRCVIEETDCPGWRGGKVGAGPPPVKGEHGWFLVYHGVERANDRWIYRAGLAMLDLEHPERVAKHFPEWVFGPQEPYEIDEKGQGIVFPTGMVERNGNLLLYYGAGDRYVGLAVADLARLKEIGEEYEKASGGR